MNSNVKFKPWVGENYEKGILQGKANDIRRKPLLC